MRKTIVTGIMLLAMTVSLAGLFGCEEEKNDNTTLLLGVTAQTWEIVAPAKGATGVSRNPTIVIQSNCELDTVNNPSDDYVELVYSGGAATAFLNSSTCAPFSIAGNTVTMTASAGTFPANEVMGPVVIYGFRCKSPRLAKQNYSFGDYSFTTGL